MPNLSVKIDDAMRQRLCEAAAEEGVTPHALMVRAIGHELERVEAEGAFVRKALQARREMEATGLALDGPAFADYLRARARGVAKARPVPQDITSAEDPVADA